MSGRLLRGLVGFLLLFFNYFNSEAQLKTDSTTIHFHQSKSTLDLNFDGNDEKLERMLSHLKVYLDNDSVYTIRSIKVIGSASPEGSVEFNRQLSEKRAQSLFDFFAERVEMPDFITEFEFIGRNWSLLYELLLNDSSAPYREEVLALLEPYTQGQGATYEESNQLLSSLKRLKGGEPYRYMYTHIFPTLRYSNLYVEYKKRRRILDEVVIPEPVITEEVLVDTIPVEIKALKEEVIEEQTMEPLVGPDGRVVEKPRKPFYMDVSTNMLYDIAAVPNIKSEFYLGKNLSIYADWMYGWWRNDNRHRYWRIYGGNIGLRWWLGKKAHEKPLTGHHIGIYAGAFIFDFEWGGKGYMGGKPGATLWNRRMSNAALEYGYSMPVGRRLNLDFSLAFGYIGGIYLEYIPSETPHNYLWQATKRLTWIGPTKAEISLVWLIGRGNVNKKKGGGR